MHATLLRYIDQVARMGSIRRAAGVLNVASSAVNRQILKFEAEIGTDIFDRVGNGVRPTVAGEHIIRHARETLSKWQDVQRQVSSLSGDIHGEIRIVSIPSAMVQILPRAMKATASLHPHISYRVIDASPNEHVEEMRAGRPDIVVQFIDQRHASYVVAARLRTRLGAVVRSDHGLARRPQVTLTECASYPVVMLDEPWILNATAEAEFTHSGAQFKTAVVTNSLQLSKEVIRAGLGIGFFTPLGFVDELSSGEFVHIPLAEPDLRASEVGLLLHRERQSTPAVKVLVANLTKELAEVEGVISSLRLESRTSV